VVASDADDVAAAAVDANGGPFDLVADVVGGSNFPGWLDALQRGGRYVTAGAIAGPLVELDLRTLYLNDLELVGATVFPPQVFADLVAAIEEGALRPVVGGTFPLEDINTAQEVFGRKQHTGNLVIVL
ncbi:MAG: zinc-binding dehydrogenase, partial [Acidimicrobiia bacterium]|nr:zinc-binding dehydrogenase [Acidimicrobiia bacterium]